MDRIPGGSRTNSKGSARTAARTRRAQAVAESRRLAQDGAIDLGSLMDKRNYRPRPGQ
jgi:hypothetical protein